MEGLRKVLVVVDHQLGLAEVDELAVPLDGLDNEGLLCDVVLDLESDGEQGVEVALRVFLKKKKKKKRGERRERKERKEGKEGEREENRRNRRGEAWLEGEN